MEFARMVPSSGRSNPTGFALNPRAVAAKSKSARAKVPCCRIWPNGEFGLSWHIKEEELDALSSDTAGGVSLGHMRLTSLIQRAEEEFVKAFAIATLSPWLVKSAKSAQRPETYGRKGITGYGAKMVRNGAHLLQEKYAKGRLAFLTLTLPEYSHAEQAEIAGRWGYLTKSLLQGLRRLLRRAGLPESVVLVTELQPRRLDNGSAGCLHLHIVFVGRHRGKGWAYSPFVYKSLWLRLLSNLLGRGVECVPCENVQPVKKDASNYLSKYLSKGSEDIAKFADLVGWERVPRQWWSCTQNVKNAVKKYTISGEVMGAILDEMLLNYWKKGGIPNSEGFKFARPITLEMTEHQDIVIGYFGRLTKESYLDLLGLRDVVKSAYADLSADDAFPF